MMLMLLRRRPFLETKGKGVVRVYKTKEVMYPLLVLHHNELENLRTRPDSSKKKGKEGCWNLLLVTPPHHISHLTSHNILFVSLCTVAGRRLNEL